MASLAPALGPGPEQRRYARAPYRTPVRIEVSGIGAVDGRSEDVSGGGLLVVARGGLKAGTEVTVRFALPLDGRVVSEAAVIKWSRAARSDESSGLCAIGVEIHAASAETLRQVERYVSLMGDGNDPGAQK
jgi:c-di-GMP-binding flagellar brake protein YcgR